MPLEFAMFSRPGVRLVQLGLRSLGYDPGAIDSWFGPQTGTAAAALHADGPAKSSVWAVETLQRGLQELGHDPGPIDGLWGPRTRAAVGRLIDFDGAPAAVGVTTPEILTPTKPELPGHVPHDRMLRQGSSSAALVNFMLHCAAMPGSWHRGKTNRQMVQAVLEWHTRPKPHGRGWRTWGYHEIICPDGERIQCRPLSQVGAGALGYNVGWKHVLMIEVGTITRTRDPENYFTPETLASGRESIAEFANSTQFRRLAGHSEVANKLCPGFAVIDRDWTDLAVA